MPVEVLCRLTDVNHDDACGVYPPAGLEVPSSTPSYAVQPTVQHTDVAVGAQGRNRAGHQNPEVPPPRSRRYYYPCLEGVVAMMGHDYLKVHPEGSMGREM